MTPPLRPSTGARLRDVEFLVAKCVIGAVFVALGVGFALLDYHAAMISKTALRTSHLALCAAIAVLGLLIPTSAIAFPIIQKVLVIASPFIPRFGTRAEDIPPPPGITPGTPVAPAPPSSTSEQGKL